MQLSDEQILNRLNESWRAALGLSPGEIGLNGEQGEITNETTFRQLDEWATEHGWFADGVDLHDILCRWLRDFDVPPPRSSRWTDVFGDGFESPEKLYQAIRDWPEEFRIRQLTDYLKRQLADVSFEPVNICGDTSGPAGAFLGIADVVKQVPCKEQCFGPSTPIDEMISDDQLLRFWQRMQVYTNDSLPKLLRAMPSHRIRSALGLLLLAIFAIPILIALYVAGPGDGVAGFALVGCFVYFVFVVVAFNSPTVFVLPDSIRTFRDLAEHVSRALHEPPPTESRVTTSFPT